MQKLGWTWLIACGLLIGASSSAQAGDPNEAEPTGKELIINGNSKKETHVCKAEGLQVVIINGNSNDVTLTGDCSSVTISGNAQKVTVDGAAKIVVSGNANKVTYLRGLKGEAPKVINTGNANKVSVRKP